MDWQQIIHRDTPQVPTDNCRPGDEVRVWYKIHEQDKERLGQLEGILIRRRGGGASKTLTVRRVTYGEGVERNFPLSPQIISKVEVLRRGHVKRSRLYYLRAVIGKSRIASAEQQTGNTPAGNAAAPTNVSLEAQTSADRAETAVAAAKAAETAKASE